MDATQSLEKHLQQQRLVLLLEYFGPAYSGCQIQSNAHTVQAALYRAMEHLKIPHSALSFAGRTDAKVHAKGQVAHMDIDATALNRIPDLNVTLNAVLPSDISIKQSVLTTDTDFHATISAQWRWYQYRIYNHPLRSTWMRPDAVWIRRPLDVEKMQDAAQVFLGEHDFESFKCPRAAVKYNVCRVILSQFHQDGDYLVFDIVANRFLYKMVRNLMGLLIQIGSGEPISPQDVVHILSQKDRQKAGPAAQPEGLSLMAAHYPKPWDFFQNDIYVTRLDQIIQESSCHAKNILRKAS